MQMTVQAQNVQIKQRRKGFTSFYSKGEEIFNAVSHIVGGAHYPDLFFVSELRADGVGRRVFVIRHRFVYNERTLSFSAFRQSKGRISDIRSLYDFFADRRHLYALLRDRARRYDVGNGDPRRRMDVRRSGNRFECGCDEPKIRKNFIDGILYRHGLASRVRARDLAAVYFGSEHLAFDFGRDRIYRGNRFFCIREKSSLFPRRLAFVCVSGNGAAIRKYPDDDFVKDPLQCLT